MSVLDGISVFWFAVLLWWPRLFDQRVPWAITSKCTFCFASAQQRIGDASLMLDMVKRMMMERPLLSFYISFQPYRTLSILYQLNSAQLTQNIYA